MNFEMPKYLIEMIKKDALFFKNQNRDDFVAPIYDPNLHYLHLTEYKYFCALLSLRHYIKFISDYYFGVLLGAKNVDLFMMTSSVSSPMGPGSDSESIPIKFGGINTNLVDSSQFGFEPLLVNAFDKVYCYLPSLRGEDFDKRHLNQFFHCEMEMRGELQALKPIIESYVKMLCQTILVSDDIINSISNNSNKTKTNLKKVVEQEVFFEISFDEAIKYLEKNGFQDYINYTDKGRDICYKGELELFKILKTDLPIWIYGFDRDRVPFYQKPDKKNNNIVVNADLLFPPLIAGSFGGEIIGCGQRQDNAIEMYESLRRQGLSSHPYEWYINLRNQKNYNVTSGFGLGVERFISWALCFDDIKNAIIYPRLKGLITYP